MTPTEAVTLAQAEALEEPSGFGSVGDSDEAERRIAAMVALGRSSREIGETLGISERTVQRESDGPLESRTWRHGAN